jgi:hypothetical protein
MNRVTAATMALGLFAGSLLAGCARVAKISAADVVARNVAARGGLDAWRKVETMVWIGHIQSAHAPVPSMAFELEQKRPNKTRLQILALGDRSVRAFDGVRGWKVRPVRGKPDVEPYTPQELRSAQAAHGIDGPLIDYVAQGSSVTLESVDDIGGRKAYHLNVRLSKGGNEQVWVDAETFLDLRYDRLADDPTGAQRRVSATYGDYQTVQGLKIPFLITTGGGQGTTPDKMQIERVVLNAPMDESTFENPAAPHPRSRMRPSIAVQGPAPAVPSAAPTAASEGRGFAPQ